MIKLYESKDYLVVDTEGESQAFPIYIFYQDKIAHVNYLAPATSLISGSNEEQAILKAIILHGRQTNKYTSEIEYYTKFQSRNEEDLSKMPNPVPKEDQEVHDIFVANIDAAKKHLEMLKLLQEGTIDSVIANLQGVSL